MSQVKRTYKDIFDGDGRIYVEAPVWLNCPGARTRMRRAQARQLRDQLIAKGYSVHSDLGHTVWVSYSHCMLTNTDFELTFKRISGMGSWVLKILGEPSEDLTTTREPQMPGLFQISATEKQRLLAAAQVNADQVGVVYTIFFDTSGKPRIERGLGPAGGEVIDRAYPKGISR